MKYSIEQLPFQDFEKLGLSRETVLSFPSNTLNALLSGNRTSLIRFEKVQLEKDRFAALDAKLSLEKNREGIIQLKVHTINDKLNKVFGLSAADIKYLMNNELSFKPIRLERNGKTSEALVTYDRVTNEMIAIDRNKLKAPDYINGHRLTEKQKLDFLSGKPVNILGNEYRLNPRNELGISGEHLASLKLGHSTYVMQNVGIDAALITAGLGHYFMLYHLANLLINSSYKAKDVENSLRTLPFRNAIAQARDEIIQRNDVLERVSQEQSSGKTKKMSVDEIKEILERKAGKHVVFEKVENGINTDAVEVADIKSVLKTDDEDNDLPIEQERPRSFSLKM